MEAVIYTPAHGAIRASLSRGDAKVVLAHHESLMWAIYAERPGCYFKNDDVTMRLYPGMAPGPLRTVVSELKCRLSETISKVGLTIQHHHHDGSRIINTPTAPEIMMRPADP